MTKSSTRRLEDKKKVWAIYG